MPSFLDSLAIFFIIIMGYSGFTKGFIEEFGRLLGLILAVFVSMSKSVSFSSYLSTLINYEESILLPFSYMLLFIFSICVGRILTKFAHVAFLSLENRLMNQTMGFFFGMVKGVTLLITFVWFISILPLQKWNNIINENSKLITYSNQVRLSVISFFNWEDPISLSESYIKKITQP
tara:strand:+ start:734 stop:1261 length:528 start_codon:yes stop_codon:yes gene_type:complete